MEGREQGGGKDKTGKNSPNKPVWSYSETNSRTKLQNTRRNADEDNFEIISKHRPAYLVGPEFMEARMCTVFCQLKHVVENKLIND